MDKSGLSEHAKFKVPYLNGKYIVGTVFIGALAYSLSNGNFIEGLMEKKLLVVFWLTWATLSVMAFKDNFSLLPIMGILTNLYLMTELGTTNWLIFVIWLVIGLVIYFSYGAKHSKLSLKN
jgi:hypothetical protein